MSKRGDRFRRSLPRLAATILAASAVVLAGAASAAARPPERFTRIKGFDEPSTPARFDRVGVLEVGSPRARNVLVLVPGTSASSTYFVPLAEDIVRQLPGWQVWAVERRENLLEDHSMFNLAKRRKVSDQQVFDYYLRWLTNPSVTRHIRVIPDGEVAFARNWGMRTEIEDLHRVILRAKRHARHVVLGGHSLGGTITTAYATWNFHGRPGARLLDGLIYIDGGRLGEPPSEQQARERLAQLAGQSPWLSFGGIPAPYAGLFNTAGSLAALLYPNEPSLAYDWPGLPSFLKPPVRPTNLAQYGYALDTETSPSALWAAQAHIGKLAPSGDPRGWLQAGEITPIRRYARMFSGIDFQGLDGTAWYHPLRLTIDAAAVGNGTPNPAQRVFDVRATAGKKLPKRLRIYAFGAAGGRLVTDAARQLARQAGIPAGNVVLVNRQGTYAHNDPAGAYPRNDFLARLVPFLRKIAR
ncbi:alpha/beta fold hydrolase [Thermoleophilum album]|uniref:Alpha/beta hydrolase family protein n=1 Tax=Thermoleophilum album TaxID=29539 RepID=A0A1H6FZQ4_THEAL|nr:alpha/beta fold hydrolase [Thermoleophilum album]SEH15800.1 Alpha/beta hydrolase family protein [Thermoleophilum album]